MVAVGEQKHLTLNVKQKNGLPSIGVADHPQISPKV